MEYPTLSYEYLWIRKIFSSQVTFEKRLLEILHGPKKGAAGGLEAHLGDHHGVRDREAEVLRKALGMVD